jgi:tRNA nucleotidyltransferase (CCA-adding enzyme)
MKIYLVGGAVRDKLLGLPIKEQDWVVVGSTPQEMLKKGYKQVGKEFPVFLHPRTNEEYALARTERKTHAGYKGFDFDVTPTISLEEDLLRRDLTINAMAETLEGELIDPYHGKQDLEQKILRHVSPAFAEDPVRILRVGRFLARYEGFHVAPETMALMKAMVKAGEVDALVAERVWKELERALTEKYPENFFSTLVECGAFVKLFPHLTLAHIDQLAKIAALEEVAQQKPSSITRFAIMLHNLPKQSISALCQQYRVPNDYKELAILTAQHAQTMLHIQTLSSEQILTLFSALDIFRRYKRFEDFLKICTLIAKIQFVELIEKEKQISLEMIEKTFNPEWVLECAKAAKSVNVQALLAQGLSGNELAAKLKEKRQEQIEMYQRDCYDR